MINTLIGIKKGMTSTYDARGRRVGATVVELGPNYVSQVKTSDGKDGYSAVQIGWGTKKSVKKPQIGHFKKANIDQLMRFVREVKAESVEDMSPGKELKVGDIFRSGDAVKVTGVSKGKGFQGGVRRHGFAGGPKTHGQSDRHRAPGSIGSGTTPGRVYRGKKMAGHMGNETFTVRNLEVIAVDRSNNLITIKGAVPGYDGTLIEVTKLGQIKGYTPPPEEKIDEEELEAEGQKTEDQSVGESEKSEVTEDAETPVEEVKEETENA